MNHNNEKGQGKKWVFPLILLALFAIGLFWWMKGCNRKEHDLDVSSAVIDSAGNSIDSAFNRANMGIDSSAKSAAGSIDSNGNWIYPQGEPLQLKLDNGVEINTWKGSLEQQLYEFIKDPGAKAGKDIWFNFNTLNFEKGSANLKPGYETQAKQVVEILKAYPKVTIKIGGYTDNEGDSLKNMKLSANRAKTVYQKLINLGAEKMSFDEKPFEGYGSQHPVAENTTAEGRAQNRRVALSVRQK